MSCQSTYENALRVPPHEKTQLLEGLLNILLAEDSIIEITNVQYVSGLKLRINFNDCNERLIDFEPFLRNSRHPEIRKYLNPELFKQFRIEYGDLVWHDYKFCFPIADLYAGKLKPLG